MKLHTKLNKSSKYALTLTSILIATTAVAAVLKQDPIEADAAKFTAATPTSSFTLDGSAQPKAEVNQLEWARCLVGQTFTEGKCTGKAKEFTSWEDALTKSVTAEKAKEGWRVPNIKELMLITEETKAYPAINTEVFPFAKDFSYQIDTTNYVPQLAPPASPFIWSSTPTVHKIATHKENSTEELTPEESVKQTEVNRKEAMLSFALDLSMGTPDAVYRDGTSVGENYKSKWGNPDANNVKRARYVLLVKDIPKA